MFRYLVLFILLLFSLFAITQPKDDIVGKWKVVSANNGVFYNYKKDSLMVAKEFRKSLVGQKDSSETIDTYIAFAKQYPDYYFVFDGAGKFEEIDNGDVRLEGNYIINKSEKKIEITVSGRNDENKLAAKYSFMNDGLHIFVKSLFLKYETDLLVEKIIN